MTDSQKESKVVTKPTVEKFLKLLNRVTKGHVDVYLVGGTAMLFHGVKSEAEDIDLVIFGGEESNGLFEIFQKHSEDWNNRIRGNRRGIKFEIFKKFIISSDFIKETAVLYEKMKNINVYLCSLEYVILIKLLWARGKDTSDIESIYKHGVDMELVGKKILNHINPSNLKTTLESIKFFEEKISGLRFDDLKQKINQLELMEKREYRSSLSSDLRRKTILD